MAIVVARNTVKDIGGIPQGSFEPGMKVSGKTVSAWHVTDTALSAAGHRTVKIEFTDGSEVYATAWAQSALRSFC